METKPTEFFKIPEPTPAVASPDQQPATPTPTPTDHQSKDNVANDTGSASQETGSKEVQREKWGTKWSFILCCIGYAVGLGNVWRFPKLAYENGGMAFLIPYWFSAMLFGLPALYFEYVLGQFSQASVTVIYRRMAPAFQGLGWTMCLLAFGVAVYYNVLIAWATLYICNVFKIPFTQTYEWSTCNNTWNTKSCISALDNANCKKMSNNSLLFAYNGTCIEDEARYLLMAGIDNIKDSMPASAEYFYNYILHRTPNINNMGHFNWPIFGSLAFVWIVTCLAIMFGAKFMGYTAYITATVPYIIIGIIFVRGISLPGADVGIYYYLLSPDFSKLMDPGVWASAVSQVCFSLGTGIAGLMNMASYNEPKNNCFRDAIIVVAADSFMSVFGGVGVFAILGFMASETNRELTEVIQGGTSLAFVAYPEATALMPSGGYIFALIFFVMLFLLGIGTQFGLVSVLASAFAETFPRLCRGRSKLIFTPIVCFFGFLCGLTMCFGNGFYFLNVLDDITGSVGIPLSVALSLIIVNYFYGVVHFLADVKSMFGEPRNRFTRYVFGTRSFYFVVCWMLITPFIGVIVFSYQCKMLVVDKFLNDPEHWPYWTVLIALFVLLFQFSPLLGFAIRNAIAFRRKGKPCSELLKIQPDHPSYERAKSETGLFKQIRLRLNKNGGKTETNPDQIEAPAADAKKD